MVRPASQIEVGSGSFLGKSAIESPTAGTRLSNGTIVIADGGSFSLRYFDSTGKALQTVGREGGGPGEFQSLPWIRTCVADSVFVWDPMANRVSVFDLEGTFQRDFRLPGRPGLLECSRGGILAVIMQPDRLSRPDPNGKAPRFSGQMFLLGTTGVETAAIGLVPAFENRPAGKRTRLAVGGERIFVGTQDSASMVVFSPNGDTLKSIAIGIDGRPMTTEAYEHAIDGLSRQLMVAAEREAYRKSMLAIPMPAALPPYTEAYADSSGTAWAIVSNPGTQPTVLARVSALGVALKPVEIGERLRVFEVGTDYVLGVTDEDESPKVILYKLR